MDDDLHRTTAELHAGLEQIEDSPKDEGTVDLIVRRPAQGEREVLDVAELTTDEGVVGDTWKDRGSKKTTDGGPHPGLQLNVMNRRAAALIAGDEERWPLAGDQLYLDLDLSPENLPPGTRLTMGSATIEVTDVPHRGCLKFRERFGKDALAFVNSDEGMAVRARGIGAKVVTSGTVRKGDLVRRVEG